MKQYFLSILKRIENVIRHNTLFNIILVVFIGFHKFFESIFSQYIICTFLKTFQESLLTRILFCFCIIYIVYMICKYKRINKYISDNTTYIIIITLILWFYYRFIDTHWDYISFSKISFLKYIDLIGIYCLSILLLKVLYKLPILKRQEKDGLLSDIPIENEDQDLLDRNCIAEELARRITKTKSETGSFAVGITAPWGYGKTSFLKLLEKHLRKNDAIVVWFNPWIYDKEKNITMAFFSEISKTLKLYNSELASEILDYAAVLSSVDSKVIQSISNLIIHKQSQSFDRRFKSIDTSINHIGKQIIVYLDDIDRLDKTEISEILKLIRNSANFSNITFVGAYDRNYLTNALQQINSYQSPIYLEKIFQLEFILPDFDSSKLKDQIFILSQPFISNEDIEIFKQAIYENRIWGVYNGFVDECIKTMRDAKRYVNTFRFAYERLKGDIDIVDLMNVELLRFKFPNIYDLMVSKWNQFLISKDDYHSDLLILWDETQNKTNSRYSFVSYPKVDFKKYINENKVELGIKDYQIAEMLLIVNALFPGSGTVNLSLKKINNVNSIRRYFYYSLLDSDLSEKEFNELWTYAFEELKPQLNKIVINKSRSLVTQIEKKELQNKDEFELVIRAVLYIGTISKSWVNDHDFITRLFDKSKTFFNGERSHKHFIHSVIKENGYNEFVSRYLSSLYTQSIEWHYILTKDEVKQLQLDFFKQSLESNDVNEYFNYLSFTTYEEYVSTGNNSYQERTLRNKDADNLFIEHIKKNIEPALPRFINRYIGNDKFFYLEPYYKEIWGSWEALAAFMNDLEEKTPAVNEFIKFMSEYKKNDYSQAIEFDFKELKIRQ